MKKSETLCLPVLHDDEVSRNKKRKNTCQSLRRSTIAERIMSCSLQIGSPSIAGLTVDTKQACILIPSEYLYTRHTKNPTASKYKKKKNTRKRKKGKKSVRTRVQSPQNWRSPYQGALTASSGPRRPIRSRHRTLRAGSANQKSTAHPGNHRGLAKPLFSLDLTACVYIYLQRT